ncbi:MAG: lysylphosphatidylglycerol synthase domain-containing protein, partial [Thermoanaerobaculia bacterium]|nr:lysylphosphatidylglycerol synthase domain-containing protein [Thermoanaerobaculia bacterium]
LRDLRLLISVGLLALLYVALNWAAAWSASNALARPLEPLTVFLALSLGTTVGALSGTPGGTLTTEAAMIACYVLLGVDRQTALAATLLYRGLHYLLVLTLGLPALVGCELAHCRRRSPD